MGTFVKSVGRDISDDAFSGLSTKPKQQMNCLTLVVSAFPDPGV